MNRACPVVLRHKNNALELLAFKHPTKGIQLAKGGIKKGESLENACIRELEEESGINGMVVKQLGVIDVNFKDQVWGFCLMHYDGVLPNKWSHETKDDGGHTFNFFWQPLNSALSNDWHKASKNAFQFIRNTLAK
jgi:ADP-ribose pyrophosphatase YjhB (NUDIX family)